MRPTAISRNRRARSIDRLGRLAQGRLALDRGFTRLLHCPLDSRVEFGVGLALKHDRMNALKKQPTAGAQDEEGEPYERVLENPSHGLIRTPLA